MNNRKDIFYLGENKTEIICGNSDCQIIKDNYNSKELDGECKCDINYNLNNININQNNENKKEKETPLKDISGSEKFKNSFEIFKCFKSGKFLKTNEGFYITICTLGVQSVCFALYLIFTPKLPFLSAVSLANPNKKKGNQEKDPKTNNNYKNEDSGEILNEKFGNEQNKGTNSNTNNFEEKMENNIMNYGNIDEDIVEYDKLSTVNNAGITNTNFHFRETNELKLDTIKIENKANFKLIRNMSQRTANDDAKSLDVKEEENNLNKKNEDNLNNIHTNVNTNTEFYVPNVNVENKPKETVDDYEQFSVHESVNKKLNFKEGEKEFEEKVKNNKVIILFGNKNKNVKSKNIDDKKNEKKKEIPLDYLTIDKAIQYDKRSFGIIFWCVFSFKQPIINILSFLDALQITKSCIPMQMKLIRFLFMLILNIFINSMTITQNYFKDKYEYFNEKYQIEESENMKIKIEALERLKYAMNHCFPEVFITFIICMILQFIINFIFFGIRRELCLISINEKQENINKEVQKLIKKIKIRYIIFAFINLIFMIIFFVYLTNFSMAYSGGALDYIGAGIWTFIFLQILPFVSSLIITFLRYYGIKKNKEGMYKMSQILLT